MSVILLDALGTLVELEPPAPHLRRELRERFDVQITHDDAQRAISEEIAYYRAHLHEGQDEARIAALRARCAEVLRTALHAYPALRRRDLTDALLGSLHFNTYPDVEPALAAARAMGRKLLVVSNWDASLHDVLARLGLAVHLDGVVTSAETGRAKPDPAIFTARWRSPRPMRRTRSTSATASRRTWPAPSPPASPRCSARRGAGPAGSRDDLLTLGAPPNLDLDAKRPAATDGAASAGAEQPTPTVPAGRGDDSPPWSTWSAPAAVVVGFAGGLFASVIVGVFAAIGGSSLEHPSPAVNIIGDVMFDLAFVGAALYFAFLHGRPQPADFGFRRPRLKLAVKAFIAAGVGYYAVTAAYATLLGLHGSDKLPSELGVNRSTAALIAASMFVCVIAPVAEEFFFRGFFFGALRRWQGPWVAAILTGLLFGLAHTGSASSEYLVPLGFLGFVLCLVRWRTGSLYPCMALHATNNSLALGINQLHWSALGVLGLILAANVVIAAVTWPIASLGTAPLRAEPSTT